ncbi:MAG: aldehyde dehydrogenase family protein [Candidatus Kapabacteria bacterium]|nr:aldehyde dehydrogenase family protein [Candidatus Kapabacteria bacterium]
MPKFENYINGAFITPNDNNYFDNISPANNADIIGQFPLSSSSDVDNAVSAAKQSFKAWKNMPAPKRGDILRIAGDIFTRRKKELAKIMTREMGKPTFETEGDVQEAIDTCYYAASETRRLFGQTVPSEMNEKINMSFRNPIGVCGIITAWNFPIAVPSWKIIPALACGNTVVWKPSDDAPHSGIIFAEILEEAGVPAGVFNVVHGDAICGQAIVNNPDVALIGFTGSTQTGTAIAEVCGRMNKRISLEMGGKNAQIIMDDANLELAVEGALWGAFGTTGQRCTATSRLIVHSSVYDIVIEMIEKQATKLRLGDGLKAETQVGPVINKKAVEKIMSYIEIGKSEGAKLVFGGEIATGNDLDNGNFIKPTLFKDVTRNMRIFQEEIFGPVLSVSKCHSLDEAIELANDCKYGLSSSIFTNDVRSAWLATKELEAGITYINAPTIGAEAHMPFGGVKGTGNGHREGGWTAFEIFTEWKTVYVDYSNKLQRAQIDNY